MSQHAGNSGGDMAMTSKLSVPGSAPEVVHPHGCTCEHSGESHNDCAHEDCHCKHDETVEVAQQEEEIDGAYLGDTAPVVDDPTPESIDELCRSCLAFVKQAVGVSLDFTPETLPILDHYVTLSRDVLTERPELLPLLTRTVGAYFGEVVRRKIRAFWQIPSADSHEWRLCARPVFLAFNPIGIAHETLARRLEEPGPSAQLLIAPEDRELIRSRFAELPPVPEDEYDLLSTRFEAIEIAVETLRVSMDRSGQLTLEFEPEDYDIDWTPIGQA